MYMNNMLHCFDFHFPLSFFPNSKFYLSDKIFRRIFPHKYSQTSKYAKVFSLKLFIYF